MMKLGGLIKNSFVDYPGKIAAVLFATGCNFDCWYCHNRALITQTETLDIDETLDFLYKRREQLDAVVFSGGEACMQDGLADLIAEVQNMGYLIKLDTNGGFPLVVRDLLQKELLDYIAMDVKAPLGKYKAAVCVDADIGAVKESIKIIMGGAPDYEFRTTCIPQLTVDDIGEIAQTIKGAKRYALQQYKHHQTNHKIIGMKYRAHDGKFFDAAAEVAQKHVQKVIVRGI